MTYPNHFDGTRFFNADGPMRRSFLRFMKWQCTRKVGPWPRHVPNPSSDVPPRKGSGDILRVSLIGHASLLLQTQDYNILMDPVYTTYASPIHGLGPKRVNPPGVAFDALPPIDLVLISHNHYDHLDLKTIARLWKTHKPTLVAPLKNDRIIQRYNPRIPVKTLDWGQSLKLSKALTLHLEPMNHWSARGWFDYNKALWGAFVIATPAGNIYFVGDTGFGDGSLFKKAQQKFKSFRLALLPIGAYNPRWFMKSVHMNPDEAVQAHTLLNASNTLGIHFGTFCGLADDGFSEPLNALAHALKKYNVSQKTFRTLTPGQAASF